MKLSKNQKLIAVGTAQVHIKLAQSAMINVLYDEDLAELFEASGNYEHELINGTDAVFENLQIRLDDMATYINALDKNENSTL